MNQEQFNLRKKIIWQALIRFRDLFNKSPDPGALDLYAETLATSYEVSQVTWALTQIIKSGNTFYPSCGEIFKVLTPMSPDSKDVGNEIANELISKVVEFGRYKDGLLDALSPGAREVFESNRYLFLEILDSTTDQIPMIRAQIRDLVKAKTDSAKASVQNKNLERIGISTGLQKIDFTSIAGVITDERI